MDSNDETVFQLWSSGLSYAQIATRVGISSNAVRHRVRSKRAAISATSGPLTEQPHLPPIISGIDTTGIADNIDDLWDHAVNWQTENGRPRTTPNLSIELPDEPVGIALPSDLHLGSPGTDYQACRRDAEIIASTPGLYAIFPGDGIDNWVTGKLKHLQRTQIMRHDREVALFVAWLHTISPKLLAVVSGNHENWTYSLAGIDLVKQCLAGVKVLYDKYEVLFTLKHGESDYVVKIRHRWPGGSQYNPTHAIEKDWKFGSDDWDIGIGGHTHIGTFFRPFFGRGKRRYAVLIGTYKLDDDYGRELGLPRPCNGGCGAIILDKGRMAHFDDLSIAADFLQFLRGRSRR